MGSLEILVHLHFAGLWQKTEEISSSSEYMRNLCRPLSLHTALTPAAGFCKHLAYSMQRAYPRERLQGTQDGILVHHTGSIIN